MRLLCPIPFSLDCFLQVPSNLRQGSYYWEVGCPDCTFFNSMQDDVTHPIRYYAYGLLSMNYDVTTILVQTDKAIYKPGQLGQFANQILQVSCSRICELVK